MDSDTEFRKRKNEANLQLSAAFAMATALLDVCGLFGVAWLI